MTTLSAGRRRWFVTFIGASVGLFLVLLTGMWVRQGQAIQALKATSIQRSAEIEALREQQQSIDSNVKASRRSAHLAASLSARIEDCLDPGGTCYRATRKQHATDLSIEILIGACAAGFAELPNGDRITATQRCVASYQRTHTTIGTPPRR